MAVTTGGKTKKARDIAHNRYHDQSYNDREDIALRVPHVTFRGDAVADTTFDADLGADDDDDISALSIHLDCHVPESHRGKPSIDLPDFIEPVAGGYRWDNKSVGSLIDELELCRFGNETDGDIVREGARNPIATTLHAEHFVMQHSKTASRPLLIPDKQLPHFTNMQHSKTASRPLLIPDKQLPHFTKIRSSPGGKIPGEVAIRPSVRHWGR